MMEQKIITVTKDNTAHWKYVNIRHDLADSNNNQRILHY